jgi:hypothetical protein
MRLITTSWDDGNVADFRLAELMQKYGLQGTFYIPQKNHEHSVMTSSQVCELSKVFEIGGHTINHVRIRSASRSLFDKEIKGCYDWLTELLGSSPVSFCFPGGVLNQPAIDYTFETGFRIVRTTELLNPGYNINGLVPTTIQVYPHTALTYIKHLIKRININSLVLYLKSHTISDLLLLIDFYLKNLMENGGCLHIWGHSWEIEELELWNTLEEIFKKISAIENVQYVNNKELLKFKNSEL